MRTAVHFIQIVGQTRSPLWVSDGRQVITSRQKSCVENKTVFSLPVLLHRQADSKYWRKMVDPDTTEPGAPVLKYSSDLVGIDRQLQLEFVGKLTEQCNLRVLLVYITTLLSIFTAQAVATANIEVGNFLAVESCVNSRVPAVKFSSRNIVSEEESNCYVIPRMDTIGLAVQLYHYQPIHFQERSNSSFSCSHQ